MYFYALTYILNYLKKYFNNVLNFDMRIFVRTSLRVILGEHSLTETNSDGPDGPDGRDGAEPAEVRRIAFALCEALRCVTRDKETCI